MSLLRRNESFDTHKTTQIEKIECDLSCFCLTKQIWIALETIPDFVFLLENNKKACDKLFYQLTQDDFAN